MLDDLFIGEPPPNWTVRLLYVGVFTLLIGGLLQSRWVMGVGMCALAASFLVFVIGLLWIAIHEYREVHRKKPPT